MIAPTPTPMGRNLPTTNKKASMKPYNNFVTGKSQLAGDYGFEPRWIPDSLFPFQRDLTAWALRKGRAAILADTGLGKTRMALAWADNVYAQTRKPVLIVTPLAVSYQVVEEGEQCGIPCVRSQDGSIAGDITVTNYERLEHFTSDDWSGVVCDEAGILKNFAGATRQRVTAFLRTQRYRLLCTATPAPNDYIELGTLSEAVGNLGFTDMLGRFFRNNKHNSVDTKGHWRGFHAPRMFEQKQWRFQRHAEVPFWQWVCSWARAVRKPSDLEYDDGPYQLPPLTEQETVVVNRQRLDGELFARAAIGLHEQRIERKITIKERCEKVAEIVQHERPALVWCHLNAEGDLLAHLIPDAVQVSGDNSDAQKEAAFIGFASGKMRVLITKPKIGAWGLNFQHCAHTTFFPSHSFEQYYQGVRRCWRFGQQHPVTVDIVTTEGELNVLKNLQRKAAGAEQMFTQLVQYMHQAQRLEMAQETTAVDVPAWL